MNDIELKKGFGLIVENAEQLIKDASILKRNASYPRSYALFQLAIEEVGKALIIYKALIEFYWGVNIGEEYLKKQGFFDHKQKTKQSLIVEYFAVKVFERSINKRTDLEKAIFEDADSIESINKMKNLSLYVSIHENVFLSPSNIITKETTDEIEYKAIARVNSIKPFLHNLDSLEATAIQLKTILDDPLKSAEFESSFQQEYGN